MGKSGGTASTEMREKERYLESIVANNVFVFSPKCRPPAICSETQSPVQWKHRWFPMHVYTATTRFVRAFCSRMMTY